MICFANELGEGFALQPGGRHRQRLSWDNDGGSLVMLDTVAKTDEVRPRL